MAGVKQLISWFYAPTSTADRLRNKDIPTQQTFENLTASVPFFKETSSKAKVSTGASLESEQGLSVLASDVQAKANTAQLTDRSLVAQPHQLPTLEVLANSATEDMPTTGLFTQTAATTTRNQYQIRFDGAWLTWLISRLFKSGGTAGQVPIKTNGTDYNWSWGQLANDANFQTAFLANTTIINALTTQIITNNPAAITDGLEVGFMRLYPSTSVPTKWLRMDGSAISRTTYADLFALISTSYGVGDGSTTFNLPDFRDRQATGYSGTKTIASTGGADSVVIGETNLPPHIHAAGSLAGSFHDHDIDIFTVGLAGGGTSAYAPAGDPVTIETEDSTVTVTGSTADGGFANTALTTMDKYLAVNMIIKVLP